jgi:hypothetical protein
VHAETWPYIVAKTTVLTLLYKISMDTVSNIQKSESETVCGTVQRGREKYSR